MNAKGHRSHTGRKFTLTSFQNTLRNTKYIGIYMYGGEEVVGACPVKINASKLAGLLAFTILATIASAVDFPIKMSVALNL